MTVTPETVRITHTPMTVEGKRINRVTITGADHPYRVAGMYDSTVEASRWLHQHCYQHITGSNGLWQRKRNP